MGSLWPQTLRLFHPLGTTWGLGVCALGGWVFVPQSWNPVLVPSGLTCPLTNITPSGFGKAPNLKKWISFYISEILFLWLLSKKHLLIINNWKPLPPEILLCGMAFFFNWEPLDDHSKLKYNNIDFEWMSLFLFEIFFGVLHKEEEKYNTGTKILSWFANWVTFRPTQTTKGAGGFQVEPTIAFSLSSFHHWSVLPFTAVEEEISHWNGEWLWPWQGQTSIEVGRESCQMGRRWRITLWER